MNPLTVKLGWSIFLAASCITALRDRSDCF